MCGKEAETVENKGKSMFIKMWLMLKSQLMRPDQI